MCQILSVSHITAFGLHTKLSLKNLNSSTYLILINLNLNSPLRRSNYQKKNKDKNINRGLRAGLPNTKCEDVEKQRVQSTRPSTMLQIKFYRKLRNLDINRDKNTANS